jgi:deglycase
VLPGGVANHDQLRVDKDAVKFVRSFFEQKKPVGVICDGPWMLAEADVARGRRSS